VNETVKPQIDTDCIINFLNQNYKISGELVELQGYCDLNQLLTSADGQRFIIKISNQSASLSNLEMQNEAMQYLHQFSLAVPAVLDNLAGKNISQIEAADGQNYNLRVLSFLEGTFYADTETSTHNHLLWQNLGSMVGKIDAKLSQFDHRGAYRFLEWDLAQGFAMCQMKKHLLQQPQSALVEHFLNYYQTKVLPQLSELPQGIIHSDANDYNVLVDDLEKPQKIVGLIDFGDMVFSHLVNELAICCAYAMMGQQQPIETIKSISVGYHQQRNLSPVELNVLIPLIALRLCTTLCNAAYAYSKEPENEYLLISVATATTALEQLKLINLFAAEQQLLVACNLFEASGLNHQQIIDYREKHLGRTLSLSYQQPLKIICGQGTYLYDEMGNEYLDMVNNVCHVGHCHPKVVKAGQQQMAKLNTNTRYLHDNIIQFSEKLLATFPEQLSVCMFVNSGSEANELAFRLAECYSKSNELLVVDGAYHGNTAACIQASPYKFDGPGGKGAAANVHIVAMPDPYRGRYSVQGDDLSLPYIEDVEQMLKQLELQGKQVGAYICESLQGVAGQIIMPEGYLKGVYKAVRKAGGVCIADEVQVGFGRVGTHMWAFETQNVIPDIVTLGKPIGNGHPMAAVVMTAEIANAFANGMEFFNTFGGNPVSCAIGSAVLDVIEEEKLMQNALRTGNYLVAQLKLLQNNYPLIGDVRGLGLFIGVELVEDRKTKKPATKKMEWLIEYFKLKNILLTSEGPHYSVLKIKPPIVFNEKDTDRFIHVFRQGLNKLITK